MKKFVKVLVSICLMCMLFVATAGAEKPGDTVKVPIYLTNSSAAFIQVVINYDTSAFTAVELEGLNGYLPTGTTELVAQSLSALPSGQIGTLTLKINNNATPKTYTIGANVVVATDIYENSTTASASAGSVTVEATACTTHKWDAGKVTKEATCKEAGVKTYTCTVCGETKTETIAKKAHTEVTDKAVEATCTKTGLTEGKHCSVCGTVTVKQETVAKKAHIPGKATVTKEPTCTETGLQSYTCTVCGTKIKDEVIAKKAHTEVIDKAVEATCTKTGLTEGKHCSVCNTVIVKQEVVAKKAHTYGTAKVTKEATCTTKGEKTSTCTVCGNTKKEEIPMKAHTEVIDKAVEATCTKTGLTEGKHCSVCNKVIVKQEVVAKKAHTPGDWVIVKPIENNEDGLQERKCTVCGTVVDTKVLKANNVTYYWNNTACSVGPAFRDVSNLTSKWYRFTPVDLSEDGTQTFDLMGSNMFIIGKVTVTVQDGNVTVYCQYNSTRVNVKSEFCTFLPSLAETTTVDQKKLTNYGFGTPISIADDLGGDTKVLLYICNLVDYDTSMNVIYQSPTEKEFLQKTNAMKDLMD